MKREIVDRLVREVLRALDGKKLGGTYPQTLARRISQLPFETGELAAMERDWLGQELLRLIESGDTKTFRQVADAREHLRKDGEIRHEKRYRRLKAYLRVYQRVGRAPTMREMKPANKNEERAIRKMLKDTGLPRLTSLPRGHRPKGAKDTLKQWGVKRASKLAA